MGIKSLIKKQVQNLFDKEYNKELEKYRVEYADWMKKKLDALVKDAEKQGKKDVLPEVVLLSAANGSWDANAEKYAQAYFAKHPQIMFAYTDEDVYTADKKNVEDPWFKPDWSPDTFMDRDYLGSAVIVRKDIWEQLPEDITEEAKIHDRLVAIADGLSKGCDRIGHIPGAFYHRNDSWKGSVEGAGKMAEKELRFGKQDSLLSVIIPSKDNFEMLKVCLDSVRKTAGVIPMEIIVVDNGSCEHAKQEIENYIAEDGKIKYIYEPAEFNFSRMCNRGAKEAVGELLLFLNDDIEAVKEGWLSAMVKKALMPWVGAVGMKLLYPDNGKIQHAGITNLTMGPVHKLQFLEDQKEYYDGRNRGVRNCIAVTGACLMVKKAAFEEAGGFCENMHVAFNDVDLCFSLHEKGYYNVVICNHYLLHCESISRGADESEEKWKRLMGERKALYERHPGLYGWDPYYNPYLCGNGLDTRVVPAYEEGAQVEDRRAFAQSAMVPGNEGMIPSVIKDARHDNCLLIRVESVDEKHVQGYAVVLGSNNAGFYKSLILQGKEATYTTEYTGQYRPDIAENMPDQENVALCGFDVKFKEPLPAGEYKIGMVVKDKVSGTSIVNYTTRSVCF